MALVRVSAPHFVAGFDMDNNRIAPIIKYMRGWSLLRITEYCGRKNWSLEVIDNEQ